MMKLFRPNVTHPTIHPKAGLLEPNKDVFLEDELADRLVEAGMGKDVTDETLGEDGYTVSDVSITSDGQEIESEPESGEDEEI
jgi:hypothetical protein